MIGVAVYDGAILVGGAVVQDEHGDGSAAHAVTAARAARVGGLALAAVLGAVQVGRNRRRRPVEQRTALLLLHPPAVNLLDAVERHVTVHLVPTCTQTFFKINYCYKNNKNKIITLIKLVKVFFGQIVHGSITFCINTTIFLHK